MSVVVFVPARGGSERVIGKNLREVGGRSLVRRAVECAPPGARVIVSTDCPAVAGHASRLGAEIHQRRPEHATARAQIESAIADWMHRLSPVLDDSDTIVLLQPTSPFRRPSTVARCVELVERGYDSALTVTLEARRSGRLRSHVDGTPRVIWNAPPGFRPRSQDGGPGRHEPYENGCAYAFSARHFRSTRDRMGGREAVVPIDWLEAFEIDTEQELEAARAMAGHYYLPGGEPDEDLDLTPDWLPIPPEDRATVQGYIEREAEFERASAGYVSALHDGTDDAPEDE